MGDFFTGIAGLTSTWRSRASRIGQQDAEMGQLKSNLAAMRHALERIRDLPNTIGTGQAQDGVRWAVQWAREALGESGEKS